MYSVLLLLNTSLIRVIRSYVSLWVLGEALPPSWCQKKRNTPCYLLKKRTITAQNTNQSGVWGRITTSMLNATPRNTLCYETKPLCVTNSLCSSKVTNLPYSVFLTPFFGVGVLI
ncbi:hypothetical protein XENTR_v10017218 [Xenopus tropicalis]|nr:hypothetical protein XENTR_v10017218 [Xenopus tropicalis]